MQPVFEIGIGTCNSCFFVALRLTHVFDFDDFVRFLVLIAVHVVEDQRSPPIYLSFQQRKLDNERIRRLNEMALMENEREVERIDAQLSSARDSRRKLVSANLDKTLLMLSHYIPNYCKSMAQPSMSETALPATFALFSSANYCLLNYENRNFSTMIYVIKTLLVQKRSHTEI